MLCGMYCLAIVLSLFISGKMTSYHSMCALAGSAGKTTTSWLIRGIFDELDKSAGLIGTVEYGIDEFLMTEEGDLWKRDEPDITLTRWAPACLPLCHSSPYHDVS